MGEVQFKHPRGARFGEVSDRWKYFFILALTVFWTAPLVYVVWLLMRFDRAVNVY